MSTSFSLVFVSDIGSIDECGHEEGSLTYQVFLTQPRQNAPLTILGALERSGQSLSNAFGIIKKLAATVK